MAYILCLLISILLSLANCAELATSETIALGSKTDTFNKQPFDQ